MGKKRRSFYGWGFEGDVISAEELGWFERTWAELFKVDGFNPVAMPRESDITLRTPRVALPAALHYRQIRPSPSQLRTLGPRSRPDDSSAGFFQPARRDRLSSRRGRYQCGARLVRPTCCLVKFVTFSNDQNRYSRTPSNRRITRSHLPREYGHSAFVLGNFAPNHG
jgi:hypothetical protein